MEVIKPKRERRHSVNNTSLMLACQNEHKSDVLTILERQPSIALQKDSSGKNALHYCAENTTLDCISSVLSVAPSLLNAADDEGYSPLHLAVISGNKALVKFLLSKGADARAIDNEKHTCIHWATVSGDCDCIDLLINSGADPSTPDIHGAYPVHYAAQMCGPNSEMGNDVQLGLAVLRKLLARGVDVACVDRDGRPPLLWAASGGSSDAILALVKAGADVNAVDRDGLTALHCAASRGHLDCLETLISLCGADVDKPDESGCSALFYAVTLGHADCTNLLLSFSAQPNKQDNKGRSPAHCGAAKGQLETLKILLKYRANLWLRNAKGDMPIHEAVQSGRKDLVEWLLQQHQGSVNVANINGRTPLHIAAITNNIDMCKVLMDNGAFINPIMKNSKRQQMTPMDAALHRGNRGCAKYLNLHGALPASKLLEKRDYNRFTEANIPSETVELSPGTRQRLLRDSSAQTEPHLRDMNVQVHFERKNATATADLNRNETLGSYPDQPTLTPCSVDEGPGRPIVAKVYVHAKRSRTKRPTRKVTAYRRDHTEEKVAAGSQRGQNVKFQSAENDASTTDTPRQNEGLHQEVPSRKTSVDTENAQMIPEEEYRGEAQILQDEDEQPYPRERDVEQKSSCDCCSHEMETENCECDCHASRRSQLLNVHETRPHERTSKDSELENQSPLSSIRSMESTVKDSGFSDDVERHNQEYEEEEEEEVLTSDEDSQDKGYQHVARYVVSSGAADSFRLELDEEEINQGKITPRSYSMPLLSIKEEETEVCQRLLNRPRYSQEVQRSLKKYQMERRLFYELQELKRKQITTAPGDETETVKKMVHRFREYVLSPFLSDFYGPFTFRAFEKFLYEQLRKLSMGGKIPKPKTTNKDMPIRRYAAPAIHSDPETKHALCMCKTYKCHHRKRGSLSERTQAQSSHLPEIVNKPALTRDQISKKSVNRSKSWDRLDDTSNSNPLMRACDKLENLNSSSSLPSLSNPFPRKVPASLLAAINERLGSDVHPEDTVVIEMMAENVSSKMRHAFTVREMREIVTRYEEQAGRRVKPIPLERVLDPNEDGPITFEIRHGKERNVFRLPASKLKANKKWFLHYCLWPVGRYVYPMDHDGKPLTTEDIRWEEIQLNSRAVLQLPPNFWT